MILKILKIDGKVLETDCEECNFPTQLGMVGILPGHAPLLCQLDSGTVFYQKKSVLYFSHLSGGIAQVLNDEVILLPEQCDTFAESVQK